MRETNNTQERYSLKVNSMDLKYPISPPSGQRIFNRVAEEAQTISNKQNIDTQKVFHRPVGKAQKIFYRHDGVDISANNLEVQEIVKEAIGKASSGGLFANQGSQNQANQDKVCEFKF